MLSLVRDHASIVARIEALRADSRAEWGKMSVAAMLAHCQRPLQVASGEMQTKRGLIGFLFGRMAKKKFVDGDAPFNRNSPTDPRFLKSDADDFEGERAELLRCAAGFAASGAPDRSHPFFGPMTPEDWDRLMWKHLDHHLRQFGV